MKKEEQRKRPLEQPTVAAYCRNTTETGSEENGGS
jgi:hypothetical protein